MLKKLLCYLKNFNFKNLFTFKKIIIYIFIIFLISKSSDKIVGPHIAVIDINGSIRLDNEKFNILEKIRKDQHVKGVVLRVNSPGGSIYGAEMYYKAVKRIAEEKPVVSFVNGSATSAAYMLILPSNHIFAYDNAIVGSVGVFLPVFDFTDVLKTIGVKTQFIKSSPSKGQPNMVEPTSLRATKNMEDIVLQIKDYFMKQVLNYRKINVDYIDAISQADVFLGYKAKEIGLVDANGDYVDVKNYISEMTNVDQFKVYNVKAKHNLKSILNSYFSNLFTSKFSFF